jgi:hypothetical protein
MVLHMMSYIYSHCRTEGRWLTGVNLQVRTTTVVNTETEIFNNTVAIFHPPSPSLFKRTNAGKNLDGTVFNVVSFFYTWIFL